MNDVSCKNDVDHERRMSLASFHCCDGMSRERRTLDGEEGLRKSYYANLEPAVTISFGAQARD